MTDTPIEPVAADPDALPRPEEEVADAVRDGAPRAEPAAAPHAAPDAGPLDPREQPAAGGGADGPAAQGDGAPDSY